MPDDRVRYRVDMGACKEHRKSKSGVTMLDGAVIRAGANRTENDDDDRGCAQVVCHAFEPWQLPIYMSS